MSTTVTVSSTGELLSALANATGGETILLESGNYSPLGSQTFNFSDYVTIKSADPDNPARLTGLTRFEDSSYIRLESLFLDQPSTAGGSSPLEIYSSDHIQIHDSRIEGGYNGAEFFGVSHLEVVGNTFDNVKVDSMKFGGVSNYLLENNTAARNIDPEADSHIDFIQFQGASSNGVIRGNVLLSDFDDGKVYQGIFLAGGATHTNVLIEQNLIYTNAANGIFVNNASGVTIRENTVLTIPGLGHSKALIRLKDPIGNNTVENNVANGGSGSGSIEPQYTNPSGALFYNDVYVNAMAGTGASIEDFRPVAGGPADFGSGIGAEVRIAELLNGSPSVPGNTAPEAQDDAIATTEDAPVTVSAEDLLSNDTDADGDSLTIISVSGGPDGTAVLNADGTISFLPNENFNGTASFSYTVSDGNGGIDTATVTVDVAAAADAPDAVDDSLAADSVAPVVVDVLENDSDADGDNLQVTSVTQGSSGSVAINADGTLTYTPYPWLFRGTDSFTYTIGDGNGGTDIATVTIEPFPTAVLDLSGEHSFDGGSGNVISLPHDSSLAIAEGTVAFSFTADAVTGRQGLLTKDASGPGNHLAIYIENGVLKARFQDGLIESVLTHGVLNAGREYEVAATFGPNGVELYVDGVLVGADSGVEMSWVSNQEYLQIGGLGWASQSGEGSFGNPFAGEIENVQIFDRILDTSQIEELTSDPITGTEGSETLVGTGGDDEIVGEGGDDTLFGLGDVDTLIGGAGSDSLWGGTGNDVLEGGDGDDILRGEGGDDFLLGGEGSDALAGHNGADTLFGHAGDDFLYGNGDDDALWGGTGNDVLTGEQGNDVLRGEDGDDYLNGGDGNDALAGHRGADVLVGGAGNDFLYGNGDDDQLWGGTGNDVLKGEQGNDILRGEEGLDYLNGGDGNDALAGHGGADILIGGAGNDFLYGNGDNDDLSGGSGNDALKGDSGDDVLNGGAGDDYLSGGTGSDTFVFSPGDGNDTLADFVAGAGTEDVIDVSAFTHSSLSDILGVATQDNADVVISLDGSTSVRLLGVNVADLHEDDFLFA